MSDDGIMLLCAAVIKQVAQDYMFTLRHGGQVGGWTKQRIEKWFHSDEFRMMSSVDPDWIIRQCKEGMYGKGRTFSIKGHKFSKK